MSRRPRLDSKKVADFAVAHPEMRGQDVGDHFGCTREYVRQCLVKHHRHKRWMEKRKAWQEKERRAAERERNRSEREALEERRRTAPPCKVCGAKVMRQRQGEAGDYITCSPECAEAWVRIRYAIDEEAHRQHRLIQARTYLRNPSAYNPSQVRWAKKMLSDSPPEPNRRYQVPDSTTTQILKEIGALS